MKGTWIITDPLWGDSGKGKFSEFFGQQAEMIIRYNGGDNAGHTVCLNQKEFKLHLIPGGIFNPKAICVLAGSMVINPFSLVKEIQQLQANGVKISDKNLLISEDAHLIMPWHQLRDGLSEKARGGKKIGTTGKGIGPTYGDRTMREGLRVKDLFDPHFAQNFKREAAWQEKLIGLMDGNSSKEYLNVTQILRELKAASKILQPMVGNTLQIIQQYQMKKKKIIGEGAQGALLDIDLGSYPYVTSSHPGVAGFSIATGIQHQQIQKVLGIVKAYSTRVGSGPMPTELSDKTGEYLRDVGHEFGATTGRARRCGWLDAVATKYGAMITGVDHVVLTKLDILDDLPEIKICVAYEVDGQKYPNLLTADPQWMDKAKPIYEVLKGWQKKTTDIRKFEQLPKNAQKYVKRIEKILGLPVAVVSVGADHQQTIIR